MRIETVVKLDPTLGRLLDVDVLPSGKWAGVFGSPESLSVRFGDYVRLFPHLVRYPIVRCIDKTRLILADSNCADKNHSAWIIDACSGEIRNFFAGDAIEDILVRNDRIVVTYFDEGIFSNVYPSYEGIAFFDAEGELLTGYQSRLGEEAVPIWDCYAACWDENGRLVFCPYGATLVVEESRYVGGGFPIVCLDLNTFQQQVCQTPERVHGASAISPRGNTVVFFNPYNEKTALLLWEPEAERDEEVTLLGHHPGPLSGIGKGRFLTVGCHEFSIIDALAEPGET